LKTFIFWVILGLFGIAIVEIPLQVFYFVSTRGGFVFQRMAIPIYEQDNIRCHRVKGNLSYSHKTHEFNVTIYTNSLGMRSSRNYGLIDYQKSDDTYRILFLGPSFTFGWGNNYEDIYPTIIERQLKNSGYKIEVINLGTPSQNIASQLCWLKKEGFMYRPDLIVQNLSVFIGKIDSECPEKLECREVVNGYLVNSSPTPLLKVLSYLKNSATIFYGYRLYNALHGPSERGSQKQGGGDKIADDDSGVTEIVRSYQAYIDFVHRVLGRNIPVVFVYFPPSYVVHPQDSSRWQHLDVNNAITRQNNSKVIEESGSFAKDASVARC
jgi:hypothetical protein